MRPSKLRKMWQILTDTVLISPDCLLKTGNARTFREDGLEDHN